MRRAIPRFSILAVSSGITGLFAIGCPAEVRAQTIFCPATFSGSTSPNQVVALSNGSCTNGQDGAFSGAALASQALSELSHEGNRQSYCRAARAREGARETPRAPSARSYAGEAEAI
jgi:hypothetical protein